MTATAKSSKKIRIFVYGSLREGQGNHRLLVEVGARRVKNAATEPAFCMRDLGSYPAIFRGGTTSVTGEIYALPSADALARVDRLEGHPHYYVRERVRLDDGSTAWTYVMPASKEHRSLMPEVISGDWVGYVRGEDDTTEARTIYFAFGSNLVADQMITRCPSAQLIGTARLPGHRIAFAGWSPTWKGGVATVIPARGKAVAGALWSLTWEDLLVLDAFEGHPRAYQRADVGVVIDGDDAEETRAWLYRLPRGETSPSDQYLGAILEGYASLGFDDAPVIDAAVRADAAEKKRKTMEQAQLWSTWTPERKNFTPTQASFWGSPRRSYYSNNPETDLDGVDDPCATTPRKVRS